MFENDALIGHVEHQLGLDLEPAMAGGLIVAIIFLLIRVIRGRSI